jgi:hypothetical protein
MRPADRMGDARERLDGYLAGALGVLDELARSSDGAESPEAAATCTEAADALEATRAALAGRRG